MTELRKRINDFCEQHKLSDDVRSELFKLIIYAQGNSPSHSIAIRKAFEAFRDAYLTNGMKYIDSSDIDQFLKDYENEN